ncbi:TniQ family protein [Rhodanobacter sp. MP7CTX1]|uniref:TniQ family protein n=1 Tax=Rhodanobacter sp. MP7CTX1 TaxID=2723084 RepID=UPI00161CA209|nr:TniQ family protein [Rhodanobacter sp. MP7CTX1]MBB6188016.1 hypothetical protein [Rhodanobacter sp. MP7CTX1]
MDNYLATPQSRRLKLVPQVLMPGESISSLVDRQAQLWGVLRKELVYQAAFISGLVALKDLDVCKEGGFLDIYAQKTGIDRRLLEIHRAQVSSPLVSQRLRYPYCPMCFHEDASAGHIPYFRLDWARIFLTHCQRHGCPLFRWSRVSSDGTRKLPHGWFIGEGPDQRSLPQFRQDLMLARAYAFGARPRAPSSIEAWNRLKNFEAWLYQTGVCAPICRVLDDRARSIERDVMEHAVTLARSATANGRLLVEESDAVSFEDQRVMSFTFKESPVRDSNPAWRDLRSGIQSIACRRAVLFIVSGAYNAK